MFKLEETETEAVMAEVPTVVSIRLHVRLSPINIDNDCFIGSEGIKVLLVFISAGTETGTGSCRNKWGKSSSGCHCDNACKGYKDCCSDYNQSCKSSDKYSYRINKKTIYL